MELRYVPPNSIIRAPNGKLAITPNRASKGNYCCLTSQDHGIQLKGTWEVEVIEYAAAIALKRLAELQGKKTSQ